MRTVIGLLCLFCSLLVAAPLPVKIVSDVLHPRQAADADMAFRILLKLTEQLEQQQLISTEFIPVSRLREWRELNLHPDVCLYNKVKTPERASFAYFSTRPIVAFPPHRLVSRVPNQLPDLLSLRAAVDEYKLELGVVDGRSYGAELDQALQDLHHRVNWVSGKDAESRVRQMLIDGKLDAVIEYSATFLTLNTSSKALLSFHRLAESSEVIYGYLACTQSPQGQRVIALFDKLLAEPSNQAMIEQAHFAAFFGQEARYVSDAIATKLAAPASSP